VSAIRKSAKGEQCLVRIPGVCNHNPETTVLAHYRLAGFCGTGMKPPDWMGAYSCSACHDVIDHRKDPSQWLDAAEISSYHLEGILRTQARLIEKGLLRVKA
jgi:hypothetical protein